MKKKLDIPEIKTRIDLLYLQIQSIEIAIQNKQLEINKLFGLSPEKFKTESLNITESLKKFCDEDYLEFINGTKYTLRKIKNLIK